MAMRSLAHTHRRFDRDSNLALEYRKFMLAYEQLGHMERVPPSEVENPRAWYLPHHAVIQSKIRIVFDASRKTSLGKCLNDFLMKGPALQSDLALILLNWRRYRYAFTADVVKMFRQIRVAPDDQDFQRIVWSPSRSDPPIYFRSTTITYGTACAPYLAIRTIRQIASDEGARYPLGASCLNNNTYVDDIFAGADELSAAKRIREELVSMLRAAGVELDKWAANHADLLPSQAAQREDDKIKSIADGESIKTLGVRWNQRFDEFSFTTLNFED
ncbi:uncharacterized protein LOC108632519 [Ceratina calcarata]|uniref:Uncharacterized protein LOC108632519 n=1 Tax=Ceratina calcarata TaxID=156304 RepID=A0AAJ7JG00_9HYME|nr:uncharacterized protein LOC108632519 [Ceratina calcarata]